MDIINKIFELEVESDNDLSESLLNLSREQPAIFHYINQEDFELLTEEEFDAFLQYHLATCERMDLMGASGHTVDILVKEESENV